MKLLKTYKTVEEEQAENYEQPEFVYDPDLGRPKFEQPGFIGGTPSSTQKNNCFALDEFSNLDLYGKPVTCVMFSNFSSEEEQFSEADKIRLKLAVKLVSVMVERVVRIMRPPPEYIHSPSVEQVAWDPKDYEMFNVRLMKWFGSTSRTTATRVREGILTMHKVLTDPLEIISFVNNVGMKSSLERWIPRYENFPTHNYEGFIVKPRIDPGHVIHATKDANFSRIGMDGMVRYIFHELSRELLDLPHHGWDDRGYWLTFRNEMMDFASEKDNKTLWIPSSWTHFVDSFRYYENGNERSDVQQPNAVLHYRNNLEDRFAKVCKLSDDSDLYPL
jgi:hypothetical protein